MWQGSDIWIRAQWNQVGFLGGPLLKMRWKTHHILNGIIIQNTTVICKQTYILSEQNRINVTTMMHQFSLFQAILCLYLFILVNQNCNGFACEFGMSAVSLLLWVEQYLLNQVSLGYKGLKTNVDVCLHSF